MNKLLLITILTALSSTAFARDNGNNGNSANASAGVEVKNTIGVSSTNLNVNNVTNKNEVSNKNTNVNGQLQGQQQSTNNSNNAQQNVNVAGDTFAAPDIPVSTAYAPTIFPTAPCMGSTSGGVQGMGLGVSLGSTWEATECMIAETARGFDQAGYKEDGLAIRCQGKYAKEAPSCKALAKNTAEKQGTVEVEQLVNYSVVSNPLSR